MPPISIEILQGSIPVTAEPESVSPRFQKEQVDQIVPLFTYDGRGNVNLELELNYESVKQIKPWLAQIEARLFRQNDHVASSVTNNFVATMLAGNLDWYCQIKDKFVWNFKETFKNFKGVLSLKKQVGKQYTITFYLNLVQHEKNGDGSYTTKLPEPFEFELIKRAFACELLGVPFADQVFLTLPETAKGPVDTYKLSDQNKISSPRTSFLRHYLTYRQSTPHFSLGDVVERILNSIYKFPENHVFWSNPNGLSRKAFFNFLKLYEPPEKEKIKRVSLLSGVSQWLLMAFVIDKKFPVLRTLLDEQGYPNTHFWIDSEHDPQKIEYYLQNPGKLGFKLWVARKLKGYTARELVELCAMDRRTYYDLEDDQALSVSTLTLSRLHEALNIPMDVLQQLADKTYPETKAPVGYADPKSVRYLFLQAIGTKSYAEALADASRIFKERTGVDFKINPRAMDDFFDLPAEQRTPALDVVLTPEMDLSMAAFLLAYGHKIDAAKFVARARPELRLLFPDFSEEHPNFKVPGDLTLASIFKTSVPLTLSRLRLDQGLLRVHIATELGSANTPMLVTLRESMDFPISTLRWYLKEAALYSIDKRLLYLSRNPWLLLFVPLVSEESGNPIELSVDPKKLPAIIGSYFKDVLRDGRFLIKDFLKKEGIDTEQKFIDYGASPGLAKKIFTDHGRIKLFADELLEVLRLFPSIDKQALLEGFKKGELLYTLGQTADGKIAYALPRPLNLKEVATQIYEKCKLAGQSYFKFWKAEPGFKPTSGAPDFGKDCGEVNVEMMLKFLALARKAELDMPHLTLKNLYLNHSKDFLNRFGALALTENPNDDDEAMDPNAVLPATLQSTHRMPAQSLLKVF